MKPVAIERLPVVRLLALPPLALYVHIPWCVRKCPYCDFNSHEKSDGLPEKRYVERLLRDVEDLLPSIWGRRIVSIFIGGGTPSLFTPEAIDALLCGVRARLFLEPDCEITLEANPGAAEVSRFRGFREAGVNRISIGVQSFDDQMLSALGRIHSPGQARSALDAALEAVGNVNLDLMYALPGQTIEMARSDIASALSSGVPHISAYQLTIEPNTAFWSRPPELPTSDAAADMQLAVEEMLAANGYEHYETSAFGRAAAHCRHNLNYWKFGDYVGIGAGAHGKVSFPDRVTRHERIKQPRDYMEKESTLAGEKVIAPSDLPFEFMLNAMRLVGGVPLALFQERTGLPLLHVDRKLRDLEARGLLERSADRLRPTYRGRLFLNDVLARFLDDEKTDRE